MSRIKQLRTRTKVIGVIAIITVVGIAASPSGTKHHPAQAAGSTPAAATQAPASQAPATAKAKAKPKPTMTTAQANAVASAQQYLGSQSFSRVGLIHQLSSQYGEGFTKAQATFAVDHVKVDWNAEAAKSAKEYLQSQPFSRAGLIQQLESPAGEGFTHAQAVYGVSQAGL